LNRFIFLFSFLLILIGSCKNTGFNNSDTALARVYDTYLYTSDLDGLVPSNASTADSLSICRNYIDNWVKNQLLFYQAEKNLTGEQKDFSRQLEDYRNSLVIYKYESELIRQTLDTLVTEDETENYYQANQQNFKLNNNIVRVVFAQVNNDSPKRERIKSLVESELEEDRDSLEFYCLRYAEDYEIVDEDWIIFNEFVMRVPLEVDKPETYLNNNKFVEFQVESDYYYVNFLEYRLSESISPLALERGNIQSIILNMRKKMLISAMKQEIFDNAMESNNFEYY